MLRAEPARGRALFLCHKKLARKAAGANGKERNSPVAIGADIGNAQAIATTTVAISQCPQNVDSRRLCHWNHALDFIRWARPARTSWAFKRPA